MCVCECVCVCLTSVSAWLGVFASIAMSSVTRHAGHYWRSRDKLISDVLLWTPTYGRAKGGRPV